MSPNVLKKGPGQVFFRAGEPTTDLVIIKEGQVLCCNDHDKRLIPLCIVEGGQFLGAESIFAGQPHAYHAVAMKEVTYSVIAADEIFEYLKLVNTWYSDTMKNLASRIIDTESIICQQQIVDDRLSGGAPLPTDIEVRIRKSLAL